MMTKYMHICRVATFLLLASVLRGEHTDLLIKTLLDLPTPEPHAGLPGAPVSGRSSAGATVFPVPSENAPLDVLANYWENRFDLDGRPGPSPTVCTRLLEACENNPPLFFSLQKWMPDDAASYERIKTMHDRTPPNKDTDFAKSAMHEYLKTHGKYFRDELIADARAAKDNDQQGTVAYGSSLEALSNLDWTQAEPIVKEFMATSGPRVSVLAASLLYVHQLGSADSKTAETRALLQKMAADPKLPALAREKALETLTQREWEGRDEWFRSTPLRDPTLRETKDGAFTVTPIHAVFAHDPDHWVALLSRALDTSDMAQRDGAVACLLHFANRPARKDAMMPLLPWLSNPKWATAGWRGGLIQAVVPLEMRESIPGLISVVAQEDVNVWERDEAAKGLGHFADPRAVPALRVALERMTSSRQKQNAIEALERCGGIPSQEAAEAVEAYAAFMLTPEGRAKWQEHLNLFQGTTGLANKLLIGGYLAQFGSNDSDTTTLLLHRIADLRPNQPELAARIELSITGWTSPSMARALVENIRNQSITTLALRSVIQQRDWLAKDAGKALEALTVGHGFAAGLAAALLSDQVKAKEILLSDDREAVAALLAAGRALGEMLPLALIEKVTCERVSLLGRVIDEYLEANDSAAARKVYWARHKGEARIIGARQSQYPPGSSLNSFDHEEEKLQREVLTAKSGTNIYALLSGGYWGSAGHIIIRHSPSGSELRYVEDPARVYSRTLSDDEWRRFSNFLRSEQIDDLGPLNLPVFDAALTEYVRLTPDEGRRVFMNAAGGFGSGGSAYDKLCKMFSELAGAGHLALQYKMASQIDGFEVLYAEPSLQARTVWTDGNDVRIQVMQGPQIHSSGRGGNGKWVAGQATSIPLGSSLWLTPSGNTMRTVSAPAVVGVNDPNQVLPDVDELRRTSSLWRLSIAGKTYRLVRASAKPGLWEYARDSKPRLVAEGDFESVVLTPDGSWAFVAKPDRAEGTSEIVRINLATGDALKIAIPQSQRILPLAFVSVRNQILVKQLIWPGPTATYWLVDPANGAAAQAQGEFAPFDIEGERNLQTSANGKVWAAIYRQAQDATDIGFYDPAKFSFRKTMTVPSLQFNSQEMWIDESAKKVYAAYHGQVVKFTLIE